MQIRRYVGVLIAGSALIAAGCSDSVAPSSSAQQESAVIRKLGGGPASYASLVGAESGSTVTFQIVPEGGSARIGDFTLTYDAASVCDPATSGYGAAYWHVSCSALNAPITMTARFWTENGQTYSDFSPDIRFSPDRNVSMSVTRPEIVGQQLTLTTILKYGIWYTSRVGDTRFYIDEAWFDPELVTHFDTQSGRVWRKIHHFSGFVVRTGYCQDNPMDPSCAETTQAQ